MLWFEIWIFIVLCVSSACFRFVQRWLRNKKQMRLHLSMDELKLKKTDFVRANDCVCEWVSEVWCECLSVCMHAMDYENPTFFFYLQSYFHTVYVIFLSLFFSLSLFDSLAGIHINTYTNTHSELHLWHIWHSALHTNDKFFVKYVILLVSFTQTLFGLSFKSPFFFLKQQQKDVTLLLYLS